MQPRLHTSLLRTPVQKKNNQRSDSGAGLYVHQDPEGKPHLDLVVPVSHELQQKLDTVVVPMPHEDTILLISAVFSCHWEETHRSQWALREGGSLIYKYWDNSVCKTKIAKQILFCLGLALPGMKTTGFGTAFTSWNCKYIVAQHNRTQIAGDRHVLDGGSLHTPVSRLSSSGSGPTNRSPRLMSAQNIRLQAPIAQITSLSFSAWRRDRHPLNDARSATAHLLVWKEAVSVAITPPLQKKQYFRLSVNTKSSSVTSRKATTVVENSIKVQ